MKGDFGWSEISSFELPRLKNTNVRLLFKNSKEEDSENFRLVSCISVPGKFMEWIPLEIFSSRHMKEKNVTGNSQHGFTDHKLCLTSLNAFYDEMSGSVDRERRADVINLGLSKAFDNFSHSILVSSLGMYGQMGQDKQLFPLIGSCEATVGVVFSFGNPQYKKDIVRLKQVQQRVTKTVKRLCTWHFGAWECPWSIGTKESPLNSLPVS